MYVPTFVADSLLHLQYEPIPGVIVPALSVAWIFKDVPVELTKKIFIFAKWFTAVVSDAVTIV